MNGRVRDIRHWDKKEHRTNSQRQHTTLNAVKKQSQIRNEESHKEKERNVRALTRSKTALNVESVYCKSRQLTDIAEKHRRANAAADCS